MSLITRCPACSTMFRVVPDQLRISDGWVRCGHCEEVFDGNAHLQTLDAVSRVEPDARTRAEEPQVSDQAGPATEKLPAEPTTEPTTPMVTPPPSADPATAAESSQDYDWGDVLGTSAPQAGADKPGDEPIGDALAAPLPNDPADPLLEISPREHHHALAAVPVASELEISPRVERDEWSDAEFGDSVDPNPGARYIQADAPFQVLTEDPKVSFLAAPSKVPGQRRWQTAAFGLFAAVLTGLLAAQWVVHDRDRLAAAFPQSRAWLEMVCGLAGCEIAPVRHIESVVIDSSAFARVRGDVFRLSFTLKNAGTMEVAAPALELTLTDMDDQALLRKVLQPEQYLGKASAASGAIAVGQDVSAILPVQVGAALGAQKVSGYRLLAFYP